MSERFNANSGLIIVPVQIHGPSGTATVRLALDTGVLTTLIDARVLSSIGYDLSAASDQVRIITASDIVTVPRLLADKIVALAQERFFLPILGHTLPPSTGVDGVLGLDFFRGQRLTINFRKGSISLA